MVFAEMAKMYESMQSFERSNEAWRHIQDIGPSAGLLFDLAELKLRLGVPTSATSGSGATAAAPPEKGRCPS